MEVGLDPSIPTYAGGLGILAGDTIKAAADLGVPMVGITLLHRKGYFHQHIDSEGWQHEKDNLDFDPTNAMFEVKKTVTVPNEEKQITVRAWRYNVVGETGFIVPVYFLDTSGVNGNGKDADITSKLYDNSNRLLQEIVLGIGGVKFLQELGYKNIKTHHMNEGHAAFLTFALLEQLDYNEDKVREKCVFTTHTPVESGHDKFRIEDVSKILGKYVPKNVLENEKYISDCKINTTLLAMYFSRYINAVSKKNAEVIRTMFPGYEIDSITNGVHPFTWTAPLVQNVYGELVPIWRQDSSSLERLLQIPGAASKIKTAHFDSKILLFDIIKEVYNIELDPGVLTIGAARRATPYKRTDLIYHCLETLKRIAISETGKRKLQIIHGGKAHPSDGDGKNLIHNIHNASKQLNGLITVVNIDDYDMKWGKYLTAGVDLWLNTPARPFEASGTSGMKAALNGVPQLSILDGWWIEGHKEGITGWSIGPKPDGNVPNNDDADSGDLYATLEKIIMPLYYGEEIVIPNYPGGNWESVMLGSAAHNGSYFTSHRMLMEYLRKAYNLSLEEIVARNQINDGQLVHA